MPLWLGLLRWGLLLGLIVLGLCGAASDDPPPPPMRPRLVPPPVRPKDERSAAVVALDHYRVKAKEATR